MALLWVWLILGSLYLLFRPERRQSYAESCLAPREVIVSLRVRR